MATKQAQVANIVRPSSTELARQFADMLNMIPAASDEDAELAIIMDILGAESLEKSNERWEQSEALQLVGEEFVIDEVVRRESDFEGNGGQFIACRVRRGGPKGASVRWGTGSTAAVAVIVRAYAEGRIPGLWVKYVKSDEPTKAGFYPRHLVVIGQAPAILG